MKIKETNDIFLLTGAGFTKNFGGFLATEMWSQIFNDPQIQANKQLRSLLQNNFDFEAVYSEVIDNNKYSKKEKEAIKSSVHNAYKNLDDAICNWKFNSDSPYPVNIYGLGDLFKKIWPGPYKKPSLFFTLNQDLFVERRWGHPSPGAPRFKQEFYQIHGRELNSSEFVTLPRENVDASIVNGLNSHNGIHYIKLHGSYGWRASGETNQLVIGTNKESLIKSEPLLRNYFDLLKSVIGENNKKVLIIGYGFHDTHINNVLLQGVEDHNLKIYIISTQPPQNLKQYLKNANFKIKGQGWVRSDGIWAGVHGYFPYSLKDFFPGNQEKTIYLDQLVNALKS
jgi:hypothetical protein